MNDAVWRAFVGSDTTLGPTDGAREAWRRGRSRYAVWIVRVDDARALERLALIAGAIRPFVDLQPPQSAHVTLFVCGFPAPDPRLDDDIAEHLLDAQDALLAGEGGTELWLGGASCFSSCVFLEVADPRGDLAGWRARLAAVYPPGHRGEVRFARYVPHITVGTFAGSFASSIIADALAPLRALEPLRVSCSGPELIDYDAREDARQPGGLLRQRGGGRR